MACDERVSRFHNEIIDYFMVEEIIFEVIQCVWCEAFHMILETLVWLYLDEYLIFNADNVNVWEHDVWGYGQMIGGHHFMSLIFHLGLI